MADEKEIEQKHAVRNAAALAINPTTAEVVWEFEETSDPNGLDAFEEEYRQIGRSWFARAPGSDEWVSFHDLSVEVREALQQRPLHSCTPPERWPLLHFDTLAQTILRLIQRFPNEFDDFDESLKDLDGMIDKVPDEALKALWRSRCSKLERLVEVVKGKVGD
ncbi:hypothetical protein [Reyranella soli]|uniref:Uncharacterized protein n=1 Tax=Reyranella soli TaxID=1230389 RepID=A0A512NNM6_9HYPH|nr:hypothetical protein [Reyranella soli]GEP60553.1 hypothetical protein RSO01_77190 [Reyranella soli]